MTKITAKTVTLTCHATLYHTTPYLTTAISLSHKPAGIEETGLGPPAAPATQPRGFFSSRRAVMPGNVKPNPVEFLIGSSFEALFSDLCVISVCYAMAS